MEIKKIEEGMTGRQVADLLYENFKTIDDNKASSELQNTVDTLIEDLEELQNRVEELQDRVEKILSAEQEKVLNEKITEAIESNL